MDRRTFLIGAAAVAAGPCALSAAPAQGATGVLTRTIPSSGRHVPAVGMGSWITFNVGGNRRLRDARTEVLKAFFDSGGTFIDSSPMYGSSEDVIGYALSRLGKHADAFTATKVWTPLAGDGISQMSDSRKLWGIRSFDLMQVHNLVGWEDHLDTLASDKAAGKVRHIGITTSHGRRHREFEQVMADERVEAVQFTYNILDRRAEQRLLPRAAELGRAVVINRPFRRGALFRHVSGHALPGWASEIDCNNWAQFFLKFVLSHPAVTCVIPATSRVDHMRENMSALTGRLPDAALRQRMIKYVEDL